MMADGQLHVTNRKSEAGIEKRGEELPEPQSSSFLEVQLLAVTKNLTQLNCKTVQT